MISGTLSKGQLFWPRMYLFSFVRDSFMCMKPWLLLRTQGHSVFTDIQQMKETVLSSDYVPKEQELAATLIALTYS